MSEKLHVLFEVKRSVAKKVSMESGKFYYHEGKFITSFENFSKEAQAVIYDTIFQERDYFVLDLRNLFTMYTQLDENNTSIKKFDFTDVFFEGHNLNEFVLHYIMIQYLYEESKPQTREDYNIYTSYLLHPNYLEAKAVVGEPLESKQIIKLPRYHIGEMNYLKLGKYLKRENGKILLDLTNFDPLNETLFASSFVKSYGNTSEELIRNWIAYLEKKEDSNPSVDEKKQWIEKFGSPHLQRAFSMNYNCQRQYVTERANKEYPEYILDFDGQSKLKERPFPSEKALDTEEILRKQNPKLNTRVEWMQKPEKECEVVVIYDYLGKYLLYKVI